MIAYIAGKMKGDENYKRKFDLAEEKLKNEGWTVLNPAVLPQGLNPRDYMPICFAMIEAADCLVVLDDWQESTGARLERDYAMYQGKPVFTMKLMENLYDGK